MQSSSEPVQNHLLHPIELRITNDTLRELDSTYQIKNEIKKTLEEKKDQTHTILFIKSTQQYCLINPFDDLEKLTKEDLEDCIAYQIPYDVFRQYTNDDKIKCYAAFTKEEEEIIRLSETGWQEACGLAASFGNMDSAALNIGTQLGFPFGFGLIAGMIRHTQAIRQFEKRYPAPQDHSSIEFQKYKAFREQFETRNLRESAAFAAKVTISLGAWELGAFVGQTLMVVCGCNPYTLWVPIVYGICAGFMQACAAVMMQKKQDDYQFKHYQKPKTSKADLAKLFITTFVTGTLWQLSSMLPLGFIASALGKALDPLYQVIKTLAQSMVAYISFKLTSVVVEKGINKLKKWWEADMFSEGAPQKSSPIPSVQMNARRKL